MALRQNDEMLMVSLQILFQHQHYCHHHHFLQPPNESSEQWSVTGVNKRKKNLINVYKFQIVRLQTEWKHTGHEENYSHFPECEQFLHKNGSLILFLKMTWSSKNCPSCLDKQLKWKDLKHLKHLIHCLLSVLSFTITLCLFITLNW